MIYLFKNCIFYKEIFFLLSNLLNKNVEKPKEIIAITQELFMFKSIALVIFALLSLQYTYSCVETRAAFDVGSGTTKMKVYKFNTCENKIIEQIKKVNGKSCEVDKQVSYKEDLRDSTLIKTSTMHYGIAAILELKKIAQNCGAESFSGVATSAFRQSANGKKVIRKIKKETGVKVSIISQEQEAILGFNGAVSKATNIDPDNICVWDIGGSSMQIVCTEEGKKKVYLSTLASVSFKNFLIESKENGEDKKLRTPNPITVQDYLNGAKESKVESTKVVGAIGNVLQKNKILGIGGVHYYSISEVIGEKIFTANDILDELIFKFNMSDEQLGGQRYVDTSVSNLIYVERLMRELEMSSVTALKVNLTEGLVATKNFWKKRIFQVK
jgi:exopolyphosphatase/guanosine-5'-triphosphate,3'-diphosphate pyrophosphatase